MRFCHACGHRAHAHLRYQFDGNASLGISVLQVVNQLCQVFNGIYVMVRWRRDQAYTGDGMAGGGAIFASLVIGEGAPPPRLWSPCGVALEVGRIHSAHAWEAPHALGY